MLRSITWRSGEDSTGREQHWTSADFHMCVTHTHTSVCQLMVSKKQRDSLTWINEDTENITSRVLCWALILKLHICVFDVDQKLNDSQKILRLSMFCENPPKTTSTQCHVAQSGAEPNNWEKHKVPEIETSAEGGQKQKGCGGRYRTRGAHGCGHGYALGLQEANKRARNFVRRAQKLFGGLCGIVSNTGRPSMKIKWSPTTRTAPSARTLTHEKNNS